MFARINNFKRNGEVLTHVNIRFEYFHHYWHLLTYNFKDDEHYNFKPNYLFLEESRFESHRSLFKKIDLQLYHNDWKYIKDKLERFFTNQPAFRNNNVVIRNKKSLVNKITSLLPLINTLTRNNCNTNVIRKPIIQEFKKLENQLFLRYPYEKRLAKLLSSILTINKPITQKDKEDIKFLVNAFIVELFHFGYSNEYIKNIPDILLLRSNLDDPLFDKKRSYFKETKDYDEYVQQEMKNMTSKTIIEGLEKLVNIPKNKGYAIFKVDGLSITKTYKIFDVEFYNPSTNPKVHTKIKFFTEKKLELFQEDETDQIGSTCNAICKIEFILPERKMGKQIIVNAHQKIKTSASVLNNILNKYSDTTFGNQNANPRVDKFFLVHEDFSLASISFNKPDFNRIEFLSEKHENYAEKELDFLNIPTFESKLGQRLIILIQQHMDLEDNPMNFNFKDLWIAWEALAKKEMFKALARASFRIYLNGGFIPKTKLLLHNHLQNWNSIYSSNCNYLLHDQYLKRLDLDITPLVRIKANRFRKKYKDILTYIDFELLRDVVRTIDTFKMRKSQYFDEVDKWINNTIDEVYVERNLEVHNKIETEFSKFKLKGDFIAISGITINEILRNLSSRNKDDIGKLLSKIEKKAARI